MAAAIIPCQVAMPTRTSTMARATTGKKGSANRRRSPISTKAADRKPESKLTANTHVRRSEGTVRAPPNTHPTEKMPQATAPPRRSLVNFQFSKESGKGTDGSSNDPMYPMTA